MGDKMTYKRLCVGLNDKGKLIPSTDNVFDHIKSINKDHYLSLFEYSEDQKVKFETKVEKLDKDGNPYETINGAKGINDVKTNILVFDFDHKTDLELAQSDTIELVDRLLNKIPGLDFADLMITFSGNKGFGVEVHTNQEFAPEEVKTIAKSLAGDLETFDPVIYNASRVFRIPFTKHPDSGLFKTILSLSELEDSSIAEIKKLASEEYEPDFRPTIVDLPESVLKLKEKKNSDKKKSYEMDELEMASLDLKNKPKWLSNWKYAIQEGFFPEGSRNHSLMILGATYRGQGFNKVTSHRMLKGAAELQAERTGQDKYDSEKIWLEIIDQVYDSGWNGGTYSEENFSDDLVDYLEALGIPRGNENEAEESELVENITEGFKGFVDYATKIDEFTMSFGIPSLDDRLKIRKGHLVYLLAPPGVGKTSFAITLLNNMSKQNTGCYFGSYDMYKNNVYQKLIQRHTGLGEEEMYDIFRLEENDPKRTAKIKEFGEILETEYKNVSFCYKVGQSINDLKRSIAHQEEIRGVPIELVVVDYLELVLTDAKDPTAASAEAAQGLREIANEGRVVVGLLQPNKMSSTPDEPLISYNAAKGSSTIAQSGTAILTAHRPGMSSENNNENDHFFGINCVKNRNGSLFSLDFGWEGNTQTIYELDDKEKDELKYLRKAKAERKMASDL